MMCVYATGQKKPALLANPTSHIQKNKEYNVVNNRIIFHSLCSLEPWQVCGTHCHWEPGLVSVRDVPASKDAKLFLWYKLARSFFALFFSFHKDGCFNLTQWCLTALISLAAVIKVSKYKSGSQAWFIGNIEVHPPWKDFFFYAFSDCSFMIKNTLCSRTGRNLSDWMSLYM